MEAFLFCLIKCTVQYFTIQHSNSFGFIKVLCKSSSDKHVKWTLSWISSCKIICLLLLMNNFPKSWLAKYNVQFSEVFKMMFLTTFSWSPHTVVDLLHGRFTRRRKWAVCHIAAVILHSVVCFYLIISI